MRVIIREIIRTQLRNDFLKRILSKADIYLQQICTESSSDELMGLQVLFSSCSSN